MDKPPLKPSEICLIAWGVSLLFVAADPRAIYATAAAFVLGIVFAIREQSS